MKFDVIVGNPPYNTAREEKSGQSVATLWDKFIIKAFDVLKDNGYLCYVHPSLWRNPDNFLWKLLSNKQILYLEMHNGIDGKKIFGVATRYDWYILKNVDNYTKSEIHDENYKYHNIQLNEWKWLPSFNFNAIKKIFAGKNDDKCEVIYTTKNHSTKIKNNKFGKYKVVHLINNNGINYMYTNDNIDGGFGIKKVILCKSWNQYPYNDYKAEYGLSEASFGIKIESKKEGELIVKAINTDKFKNIILATKWSKIQTDYKMFGDFKKDFWKYFIDENGNEIDEI